MTPRDAIATRLEDDPAGLSRNPFATRYVASARLAALDESGRPRDIGGIADRVVGRGRPNAIVGGHGSGKSTLLWQLADALEDRAIVVTRSRVRRRADLVRVVAGIRATPRGGIVCIDGWEVLGAAGRLLTGLVASVNSVGLLVTAHRRGHPRTLVECRTSPALLRALVASLPGRDRWFGVVVDDRDLEECFRDSSGDVRRAFDLLYDRFERRRTTRGDPPR